MATVVQLQAALPNVSASRREFAESLVRYFNTHGRWSARQQFFADQIVEEASRPAAARVLASGAAAYTMPAEGAGTVLRWFANVRRANPRGRARVTFPRASVGAGLRLSAPSPTSRYSADNTFFVHREREYAGRVTDNQFYPASAATANMAMADLQAVLADPLAATIHAGRATGNCCFCARELTDERSVSVGYGPICAGHYGLPWGETPAPTPARATDQWSNPLAAFGFQRFGESADAFRALADALRRDIALMGNAYVRVNAEGNAFERVAPELSTLEGVIQVAVNPDGSLSIPSREPEVIDVTTILDPTRQFVVGLPGHNIGQITENNVTRPVRRAVRDVNTGRVLGTVPPARPDLPSYEDGGPDDEDRQFM